MNFYCMRSSIDWIIIGLLDYWIIGLLDYWIIGYRDKAFNINDTPKFLTSGIIKKNCNITDFRSLCNLKHV